MAGEDKQVELLWHRRHALQIAMQLPETQQDALLVLEAAKALVLGFLTDDQVCEDQDLPLPGLVDRECVVLAFAAPTPSPSNR